jgi:hypothetical protein
MLRAMRFEVEVRGGGCPTFTAHDAVKVGYRFLELLISI